MNEDNDILKAEDLLNEALENVANCLACEPVDSDERKELHKELMELLEMELKYRKDAREAVPVDNSEEKKEKKIGRIIEIVKTTTGFVVQIAGVVIPSALAVAMFRMGVNGEYMGADEVKAVGWLNNLLLKKL